MVQINFIFYKILRQMKNESYKKIQLTKNKKGAFYIKNFL